MRLCACLCVCTRARACVRCVRVRGAGWRAGGRDLSSQGPEQAVSEVKRGPGPVREGPAKHQLPRINTRVRFPDPSEHRILQLPARHCPGPHQHHRRVCLCARVRLPVPACVLRGADRHRPTSPVWLGLYNRRRPASQHAAGGTPLAASLAPTRSTPGNHPVLAASTAHARRHRPLTDQIGFVALRVIVMMSVPTSCAAAIASCDKEGT